MNQYLKKYKLTTEGERVAKAGGLIHLPKNGLGDPQHRFNLRTIFDEQATALIFRRDKQGALYVEPRKTTPADAKKE